MTKKELLPFGLLQVVTPEGEIEHADWVPAEARGAWEALKDSYGTTARATEGGEEVVVITIPKDAAVYKKATPLSCLFNSTQEYLRNILGVRLELEDKDFFDAHPLVGASGVSQPNTLRVVQEIISPYNLRVKRIRALPGTMLMGDLAQWKFVLGMNPLALADGQTSNEDFSKITGLPLEEAHEKFRFEFSDEPLRPSITCGEQYEGKDTGASYTMGHATYKSPRSKDHDAILHIQIDRKENTLWDVEPVFPDLANAPIERQLSIYSCKLKDGREVYAGMNDYYAKSKSSGRSGTWSDVDRMSLGVGLASTLHKRVIRECFLCGDMTSERYGANACKRCWSLYGQQKVCEICNNPMQGTTSHLKLRGLSRVKGSNIWTMKLGCPWCNETTEIVCMPGSLDSAVCKAIRGEGHGETPGSSGARTSGLATPSKS